MRKDCPSQQAYIAIEDGYISASDIEDDEEEEAEEAAEGGHVLGSENTVAFRSIIVKRVLSVQAQQPEKLQRHNLFQIFFIINNRRARVIIDGGSCNNLVSSDLVKKLGLATRPHPHPYHIQWFNDKVTQSCRVSFSIGSYADYVDCDVVSMEALHHGRINTYTFMHKGKKITLLPMTPAEIVLADKARAACLHDTKSEN